MPSEQEKTRTTRVVSVVMVLATVGVMASVGFIAIDTVADEDFKQYIDDSKEWCEDRGGELFNANVIGDHGGLHCELPSGESVHMNEVIDYAE